MSTTTATPTAGAATTQMEVTSATLSEVRAFAADESREIHLERRGDRTYLIARSD